MFNKTNEEREKGQKIPFRGCLMSDAVPIYFR